MPYNKINFDEQTPLNSTNLDQMETQYDEVLNDVGANMADSTKPLRARVVSTFPALADGSIIYHTGFAKYFYGSGSAWKELGVPGQSQAVIE